MLQVAVGVGEHDRALLDVVPELLDPAGEQGEGTTIRIPSAVIVNSSRLGCWAQKAMSKAGRSGSSGGLGSSPWVRA